MLHLLKEPPSTDSRPVHIRGEDERFLKPEYRHRILAFKLGGLLGLGVPLMVLAAIVISQKLDLGGGAVREQPNGGLFIVGFFLAIGLSFTVGWLIGVVSLSVVASQKWGLPLRRSLHIFMTMRYPFGWYGPRSEHADAVKLFRIPDFERLMLSDRGFFTRKYGDSYASLLDPGEKVLVASMPRPHMALFGLGLGLMGAAYIYLSTIGRNANANDLVTAIAYIAFLFIPASIYGYLLYKLPVIIVTNRRLLTRNRGDRRVRAQSLDSLDYVILCQTRYPSVCHVCACIDGTLYHLNSDTPFPENELSSS